MYSMGGFLGCGFFRHGQFQVINLRLLNPDLGIVEHSELSWARASSLQHTANAIRLRGSIQWNVGGNDIRHLVFLSPICSSLGLRIILPFQVGGSDDNIVKSMVLYPHVCLAHLDCQMQFSWLLAAAVPCCLSRHMAEMRGVRTRNAVQTLCSCLWWTHFQYKPRAPLLKVGKAIPEHPTGLYSQNSQGYPKITLFMWYFISSNGSGRNLVEMFASHACLHHGEAPQS